MSDKLSIQTIHYIGKQHEAKDTVTLKFTLPEGIVLEPGTHFHVAFDDFMKESGPDKSLVRTFSLMSLKEEQFLGFTTRIKEDCSPYKERLKNLQEGERMFVFKVGNRMQLRRVNRPVVFISMGVALATFRPLIKEFEQNSDSVPSITSIHIDSRREFLFRNEIESIQTESFINHYVGSRKELYETIDNSFNQENALYYIVGSDEFLQSVITYLLKHSIENENIIIDKNPEKAALFL